MKEGTNIRRGMVIQHDLYQSWERFECWVVIFVIIPARTSNLSLVSRTMSCTRLIQFPFHIHPPGRALSLDGDSWCWSENMVNMYHPTEDGYDLLSPYDLF